MNNIEKMREKEKKLSFEEAKEMFDYNPDTGLLFRKTGSKYMNHIHINSFVGWKTPNGYMRVSVNNFNYNVHRLIWLLMTGKWPEYQIDHINGIRDDNRFCNLREATLSQNSANRIKNKNKSSCGYKGVFKDKNGWQSRITLHGNQIYLGNYGTPEEAHAAYVAKAKELFGDYTKV